MSIEKGKPNKNIHGKPIISSGHDISVTSSQWYGAAVFYLLKLGKIPIKELWVEKYATRNLVVGYLVKLAFLAIGLYLLWIFYGKEVFGSSFEDNLQKKIFFFF